MRRLGTGLRLVLALAVVIVLAGGVLLARGLMAAGLFTSVTPGFSGRCTPVGGIQGAEDLQIDAPDGLVFLSASNRRAQGAKGDPRDGLYTMNLDGPPRLTRLAGTPPDFHPHGLSLLRLSDGSLTLMVINHRSNGMSAVDIFDVKVAAGAAKLAFRSMVEGGLLVHPNDIAAVSPVAFYVTNDSTVRNPTLRTLEDYALLRQANVVYFDGNAFRVVARGLDFANGIQVSPDGSHVYVAATMGRTLYTYTRESFTGTLTEVNSLAIGSGLDNIDIDAQGNLWIAGHPNLLGQDQYQDDPARPAASQIFKVVVNQGVPQSATPVYVNNGDQIGDASVGALIGKRLLIGTALDDKILDCTLK